jgi:rhodanese-related sulfurtransferase
MATLKNIDVKEAVRLIHEQVPFVLDVRTTEEYRGGHIANSFLIQLQDLESRAKDLPQDYQRSILVYCRSGNRSLAAGDVLIRCGYKNVYNLVGGIGSWQRSGEPLVK